VTGSDRQPRWPSENRAASGSRWVGSSPHCNPQPRHPTTPRRGEWGALAGSPGALLQPQQPRPLVGWARGGWRGKTHSLEGLHPSPTLGDGGIRRGTPSQASPALPWPWGTTGLCLPPLCAGRSQGSQGRALPSPWHLKVGATACRGAAVPPEPLTHPPHGSHPIPPGASRELGLRSTDQGPSLKIQCVNKNRLQTNHFRRKQRKHKSLLHPQTGQEGAHLYALLQLSHKSSRRPPARSGRAPTSSPAPRAGRGHCFGPP